MISDNEMEELFKPYITACILGRMEDEGLILDHVDPEDAALLINNSVTASLMISSYMLKDMSFKPKVKEALVQFQKTGDDTELQKFFDLHPVG